MKKLFILSLISLAFACQENPEIEPIEIVEAASITEEEIVIEISCFFGVDDIVWEAELVEEELLAEIEQDIVIDLEELIQEQPVVREVPVQ